MGLLDRLLPGGRAVAGASNGDAATVEQQAQRIIDEGNAIEQEGRFAEALQRYDAAVKLAPNLARAYLNRGNVLLEMNDPEAALASYRAEHKEPLRTGEVPPGCEIVEGPFWHKPIARHDRRRLAYVVWTVLAKRLL